MFRADVIPSNTMVRDWEIYTGGVTGDGMYVRVSDGTVVLSREAHNALERAAHLVFMWDADNRAIGIRAPQEQEEIDYSFKVNPSDMRVICRNFLRYIGHPTSWAKYPAHIEGDVLVIPLTEEPAR